MPKIAVLDDWQGVAETAADWTALQARAEVAFLRDALTGDDLVGRLQDVDAIVLLRERTELSVDQLDRLPALKMIAVTGGPPPSLDIAACAARGITVSTTQMAGPYSPAATAELTLGLIIAAQRGIPTGDAAMRDGGFQETTAPGRTLEGLTLGIVGLGNIGARLARYGRALGMTVIAWSPNLTTETAAEHGAERVSKEDLLATADVITVHLKLSDRSRGVIGAADLARMKPGALLVNTSRGPLIDEAALVDALRQGRIRAALDVYAEEPLPRAHPLRSAPGTTLTPHLGYVTQTTLESFYRQSVENLLAFLDGAPIRQVAPRP